MQLQNPPSSPLPTTPTTSPKDPNKQHPTKTTLSIILSTSLFSLILFFLLSSPSSSSSSSSSFHRPDPSLFPDPQTHLLQTPTSSPPSPPSLAYFISGSSGHSIRSLRLLLSLYHPKNYYLLHLDRVAGDKERELLAESVRGIPVFRAARNVEVLGKADFAYPKGSSPLSAVLRGAAVALRLGWRWDWFVSIGALDYPLVTQDGMI